MKNKTKIIIAISIVLSIFWGCILLLFNSKKPPPVGEFDLGNYQWEINNFPLNKNVGQIDDGNTAIKKAKEVWVEIFSSVNGIPYNPINGKPIKVYFDLKNDCWYVHGTLPRNWGGGVPNIIFKSNGDVIAVWHDD